MQALADTGFTLRGGVVGETLHDRLETPGGTPIVVHGGRPEAMAARYAAARKNKPAWRQFLNKVGKRLSRV